MADVLVLEGVRKRFGRFTAGHARLELAQGVEPHAVLEQALRLTRIVRFEIQCPELQEIFVKLVRADGQRARATGSLLPAR